METIMRQVTTLVRLFLTKNLTSGMITISSDMTKTDKLKEYIQSGDLVNALKIYI